MEAVSKGQKVIEVFKSDFVGEMALHSVLSQGEAFQSETYHRLYNALSSVMKDHKKLKKNFEGKL